MKQTRYLFIVLWVLLAFPAAGLADSAFQASARVDKTRMTLEDTLTLQVVSQGGKADVDLSALTDFRVVSSGTSTSMSYTNGVSEYKVTYQYSLIPLKKGDLVIPGLTVSHKGKTVKTDSIRIKVMDTPVAETGDAKFFAKALVSRQDPVKGQQILYTFQLFQAERFSRASLETPGFEGFSVTEIKDRKNYERVINGRAYVVTEIRYLLTPEQPGDVTIGPGVVTAQVVVKSGADPFDSMFNDRFFNRSFFSTGQTKTIRIASNPVTVTVRGLPAYTGKGTFSGLVGRFTLDAGLDKHSLDKGGSATLTVTIQGTGNIMDAGFPEFDLDDTLFKVYEDAPVEEIVPGDQGMTGKKVFKRALVPLKAGKMNIPALSLVYFDVDQNRYTKLDTAPLALEVAKGQEQPLVSSQTQETAQQQPAVRKKDVVLVNKDILDIREDLSALTHQETLGFAWFLGLVAAPGLVFGMALLVFRVMKREKSVSALMAEKARSHLKEASRGRAANEEALGHVHSALIAAVLSRAGKRGESVTLAEAGQILAQTGASQQMIEEVQQMFETLEGARFGGHTIDGAHLLKLLSGIRKIIQLSLVFAVVLASLYPAGARAQEGTVADKTGRGHLFMDGITAYKQGDYDTASKDFEAIAASGVVNAGLYYNLGNAYLKAGDLGRAVLWYERAKKRSPGDPDIAFNLGHAQSLMTDKIDPSFSLGDVLFFWQGVVPLKWIQAGAVAGSCLFFLWAGVRRFRGRKILSGRGMLLIFIPIFLTMAAGLEYYSDNLVLHAVVVQDVAPVRSGTTPSSTRLFDLHAGTKVRVEERRQGYLKIMLTKEKVGWIKSGDAIVI